MISYQVMSFSQTKWQLHAIHLPGRTVKKNQPRAWSLFGKSLWPVNKSTIRYYYSYISIYMPLYISKSIMLWVKCPDSISASSKSNISTMSWQDTKLDIWKNVLWNISWITFYSWSSSFHLLHNPFEMELVRVTLAMNLR